MLADRVMESSTTTGTGNIALAGAVTGFQSFKMEFADGDQVNYEIEVIDVSENQEVNHAC